MMMIIMMMMMIILKIIITTTSITTTVITMMTLIVGAGDGALQHGACGTLDLRQGARVRVTDGQFKGDEGEVSGV
jgi:transcription antitermination factor NusG